MNQMNGPMDGEVLVVVAGRVKRMHVCFEKRRKCPNHEHSGSSKLGLFLRKNMRNKCRVGANKAGRHPGAALLSGRPFNCAFYCGTSHAHADTQCRQSYMVHFTAKHFLTIRFSVFLQRPNTQSLKEGFPTPPAPRNAPVSDAPAFLLVLQTIGHCIE